MGMRSLRLNPSTPPRVGRAAPRQFRHAISAGVRLSRRLSAGILLAATALLPASAHGQELGALRLVPVWRVIAEAGGSIGGTWLEGVRAPKVVSKPGFLFGLGLQRGWTEFVAAGASIRAGVQPVEMQENGERWSGGTVTEADLVATLSFQSRQRTTNRISLDVSGGAAVLAGANDVLPFQDAQSLAPLLEVGVALRRGLADSDASRKDLALIVRYSMLKLQTEYINAVITPGWVGRTMIGLRITR